MNDYPVDKVRYEKEIESVESYHNNSRTIVFTKNCVFFFTDEKESKHFSKKPYWEFIIKAQESLVIHKTIEDCFMCSPNSAFESIKMPVVTVNSLFKEEDSFLCLVLHHDDISYHNIAKLIETINKVVE